MINISHKERKMIWYPYRERRKIVLLSESLLSWRIITVITKENRLKARALKKKKKKKKHKKEY